MFFDDFDEVSNYVVLQTQTQYTLLDRSKLVLRFHHLLHFLLQLMIFLRHVPQILLTVPQMLLELLDLFLQFTDLFSIVLLKLVLQGPLFAFVTPSICLYFFFLFSNFGVLAELQAGDLVFEVFLY